MAIKHLSPRSEEEINSIIPTKRELILRRILLQVKFNYLQILEDIFDSEGVENEIRGAVDIYNNTIYNYDSEEDFSINYPAIPLEDDEDKDKNSRGEELQYWPSREGEYEWLIVESERFLEKYKELIKQDYKSI